jgi:RNA polymerase sigma-70 factor (ECF subfamily)
MLAVAPRERRVLSPSTCFDRARPAPGFRERRPNQLKPDRAMSRSKPTMETLAATTGGAPAPPAARVARGGTAQGVQDEEAGLVARARARDQEAYRELVERHRDRAYGLALRIVRSPADAEEVAQDAFVRAWLALPGFRGEARFSTWLHRIVARRALDRAAVLRGRRAREAELEEAHGIASGETSDAAGERVALALRMERLLGELSPAQRAVVTLFYYEGHSVEQVAAGLAMPENTVKTHLSRARAALRAAWTTGTGSERP